MVLVILLNVKFKKISALISPKTGLISFSNTAYKVISKRPLIMSSLNQISYSMITSMITHTT